MKCCSEGHYHVEGVGVLDVIEMDHIVELLCVCEGIHRYLLFHESLLSFRLLNRAKVLRRSNTIRARLHPLDKSKWNKGR